VRWGEWGAEVGGRWGGRKGEVGGREGGGGVEWGTSMMWGKWGTSVRWHTITYGTLFACVKAPL